jgi:hypothetical protein
MAHELDFSKGIASFAFTGDRDSIWHGLGQEILPTDSIDVILKKAGLDWNAVKAPVQYAVAGGSMKSFKNTSVIYRDDTGHALGTVSDNRYSIVQPREIMEFFRDFLSENGLSISTAGGVRGGRMDSYVRLQTSFDGTRATDLVATVTRQVCANTMRLCDADADRDGYRVSHSTQFDAKALQSAFGLLGQQHQTSAKIWNALAKTQVTDAEAAQFFCDLLDVNAEDFGKVDKEGKKLVATRTENKMRSLLTAYKKGPGADAKSAKDTAFGLLNAVTYYVDHEATTLDMDGEGKDSARLTSAWFGTGAKVKDKAQRLALALTKDPELMAIAA